MQLLFEKEYMDRVNFSVWEEMTLGKFLPVFSKKRMSCNHLLGVSSLMFITLHSLAQLFLLCVLGYLYLTVVGCQKVNHAHLHLGASCCFSPLW